MRKQDIMITQEKPKVNKTLSSLAFILIAIFTFVIANGARAENIIGPERQFYAEQKIGLTQSPVLQNHPEQQTGLDPTQSQRQQDNWRFFLGVAVMCRPAFLGSDNYQAIVLPSIKVEYKDRFFASPFEIGFNVINRRGWRAGSIVKLNLGRAEDDDNPFRIAGRKTKALRGLGDVGTTPEIGGFLEYNFKPFKYELELRQGIGGHEGLVAETSLNYVGSTRLFGKRLTYAFGPRAGLADSDYTKAYFGISQKQSARSGLARYSPGAGLVSYGIGGSAIMSVSESISLAIFGGYDRLGSVAGNSPLVKRRGDENQFTGGARISCKIGN